MGWIVSKSDDLYEEMEIASKVANFCLHELELNPSPGNYIKAQEAIARHRAAINKTESYLAARKSKQIILLCAAFILGVITYQYLKR